MENSSALSRLIEAALEIARRRRETLVRLRAALERGDNVEVWRLAKQLCGVKHEQESDRTRPSVN